MIFSVIIPAYNCERTIERCLRSVIGQSFRDYEVIMVDDGSTDDTGEICKYFTERDERFRYYYKENGGVSTARNYGISRASGKYVTFLDSDDVYDSKYLADFYELIREHPDKEHFWCGYQYVLNNGKQNGRIIILNHSDRVSISERAMLMTLQDKELVAPIWNKVYVRDVLVKNHIGMPPDLSLGEDYLFNLEYLDCCNCPEIVVLNEANYGYYVFSDESLNFKFRSDLWSIYNRLLDATIKALRSWQVPKEQRKRYYNIAFYMYDQVLRNTFHAKNRESVVKKIRYNNRILRSRRFRKALKHCDVSVNKTYLKLYSFGDYRLLMLADALVIVFKGIKKKIRFS